MGGFPAGNQFLTMNDLLLSSVSIEVLSQKVAALVLKELRKELLDRPSQGVDSVDRSIDRFIDKRKAAHLASVCVSTIDNWGRSGKITRHYFGGSVRFWLPELLEFLKSHKVDQS